MFMIDGGPLLPHRDQLPSSSPTPLWFSWFWLVLFSPILSLGLVAVVVNGVVPGLEAVVVNGVVPGLALLVYEVVNVYNVDGVYGVVSYGAWYLLLIILGLVALDVSWLLLRFVFVYVFICIGALYVSIGALYVSWLLLRFALGLALAWYLLCFVFFCLKKVFPVFPENMDENMDAPPLWFSWFWWVLFSPILSLGLVAVVLNGVVPGLVYGVSGVLDVLAFLVLLLGAWSLFIHKKCL